MLLDQILLLRSRLVKRDDCLANMSTIYVLVALKYLNQNKLSSTIISIHYFLKKARRSRTPTGITVHLVQLINAGYATKKRSSVRITEAGKQALSDIDKQLKQARYAYGRTKQPANKPKPLY